MSPNENELRHVSPCLRHFYTEKLKEASEEELRRFLDEAEKDLADLEVEKRLLAERNDMSPSECSQASRHLEEDDWHFRARLAAVRSLLLREK